MVYLFNFDKTINRLWLFEENSEMSINHIIYGAVTIHIESTDRDSIDIMLIHVFIIGRTHPSLYPVRLFNLRANKRQ